MAAHSSTLAWKIPWMEEPGRLLSMGSRRVELLTECFHFHFSLSCIGEGNGNPLQCSCLENPRDGGAWWAAVYGVAQSRTRLKRLAAAAAAARLPGQTSIVPGLQDHSKGRQLLFLPSRFAEAFLKKCRPSSGAALQKMWKMLLSPSSVSSLYTGQLTRENVEARSTTFIVKVNRSRGWQTQFSK